MIEPASRSALLTIPMVLHALVASAQPAIVGTGDLGCGFEGLGDLSADGATAVGAVYAADCSYSQAFAWTDASEIEILQGLESLGYSFAQGASSDGSIIVGYMGEGPIEAFRWTGTGGVQGLGVLDPSDDESNALSISADGTVVVGISFPLGGGTWEAFRWTESEGMVGLGFLPSGGVRSTPWAVSADGSVIVGGNAYNGSEGEAFRWTSAGGMVGLGDLPGGNAFSEATAVSADGTIVAGRSSSSNGFEAFIWTLGSGMVALGQLDGSATLPSDISGDGTVIVGNIGGPSSSFIWDAANGMRSLATALVEEYGVDLAGWSGLKVFAISEDGHVIAGDGTNAQGNKEGWIVNLPTGIAVPSSSSYSRVILFLVLALIGFFILRPTARSAGLTG